MLALSCLTPPQLRPTAPPADVRMVTSWYDAGLRLDPPPELTAQEVGEFDGRVVPTSGAPAPTTDGAAAEAALLQRYLQLRTVLPQATSARPIARRACTRTPRMCMSMAVCECTCV